MFCFSRERSPRGDQGLKTCLLALISNISTTTHLFSSICVFVSRESIEVGFEIRPEASVTAAILDCTGALSMVISRSSLLFFCWGCIKIIHNFLILFILRTFWNVPKKTLASRASRFEPMFFFYAFVNVFMSSFSFHCSLLRSFLVFLMCMCVCVFGLVKFSICIL